MPVEDPFDYSSRWGSVGLDCSSCLHFAGPPNWPDSARVIFCRLHRVSLRIELGEDGYKEGEWFCRDFENNGSAHKAAQRAFEKIAATLTARVLYRVNGPRTFLHEIEMGQLPASAG